MNLPLNHQQFKKKYIGINTIIKNHPINVVSGSKKTQSSHEKQTQKIISTLQSKSKYKSSYLQESEAKLSLKPNNLKHLKENACKKENDHLGKTQDYGQKEPLHHKSKRKEPQSIEINVNIQNVALLRNKIHELYEKNKKTQRSIVEENPAKSRKLHKTNSYLLPEDFQCTQEFFMRKSKIPEKSTVVSRKQFQKQPSIHQVPLDPHQLIRNFEQQMNEINSLNEEQTIIELDKRQLTYQIDPHYIQKKQKHFNWSMRATLMEWMMHVSYEFSLNRETFHIAINLVDLYMSRQSHLTKCEFQLIGATTMFIASKLEQFQPKSSEQFASSTNRYSGEEIKQTERKICTKLQYNLNPPTLFMWANRFMVQWDQFLHLNAYATSHELFYQCEKVYFKKFDGGSSFKNYRIMMQLLDCAALDIQTVQYKQKLLVCAFMYLILGRACNQFKTKEIVHEFPRTSLYLLNSDSPFNDLFSHFLQISFGIVLIDLLPTIQYTATFFILGMSFQPPIADDFVSNDIELEQYCCLQTYNPNTKAAILKRFRGIYQ